MELNYATQIAMESDSRSSDTRINKIRPLIPPACLISELPCSSQVAKFIVQQRNIISDIIHGKDDRLVVVIGPCSVHCVDAAIDYAKKLKPYIEEFKNELYIVMRVYFEKPRTTVGWKGLINDPHLDGSFDINTGLRTARKLLLEINSLGIPVGSEMLDTISPQFIADLLAWGAIGARTCESQLHRELTSGLSFPIGIKNGTTGSIKVAVDAIVAGRSPHCFIGVTNQGLAAIVETKGNEDCHLVLRGGDSGPNYQKDHIHHSSTLLKKANVPVAIMVDVSHGNSSKNHNNQPIVIDHICQQLLDVHKNEDGSVTHNHPVFGLMIESNLVAGNQSLKPGMTRADLVYGQSITDACIGWDSSVEVLHKLAATVRERRRKIQDISSQ